MQMLDDASSESGISMGGSSGGSPSQVRIISHEQLMFYIDEVMRKTGVS